MDAVSVIGQIENQSLFEECENHIQHREKLRSLDGILEIPVSVNLPPHATIQFLRHL